MWELIIIGSFCFFFWLARKDQAKEDITTSKKDGGDVFPLVALYAMGFWEDDDAVHTEERQD